MKKLDDRNQNRVYFGIENGSKAHRVYFGIENGSKAHRLYDPQHQKIHVSRQVVGATSVITNRLLQSSLLLKKRETQQI